MENASRGLHALPARTRGVVSLAALAAAAFGATHLFGRAGDPRAVLLAVGVLAALWALSGARTSVRVAVAALVAAWSVAFYIQAMRADAAPGMPLRATGAALVAAMVVVLLSEMWALRILSCGEKCGGGGCGDGVGSGGGCGSGKGGGLSEEQKRALLASLKAETQPPPRGG